MDNMLLPIALWNVNDQRHRTDNAVEGWNSKLNGMIGRQQLNVQLLVKCLKDEANNISHVIRRRELGEFGVKRKKNDDSQSLKEWAIIEVQGDLESSTGDSISGKLIGHLIYSAKGRPILIIGYHILYGKIVENNPPLAILQRSRSSHALSSDPTYNDKVSSTEYTVLALVKKKITFRTRPKPIISVCH
ncbi:unnamed protein product [Larinioides sclopetarius]|uniref:Uncharacterized protein n=1 Tax=Larinioides sclopetarius TaxID=280406 RepID=A0AAV1Z196_9ARAC